MPRAKPKAKANTYCRAFCGRQIAEGEEYKVTPNGPMHFACWEQKKRLRASRRQPKIASVGGSGGKASGESGRVLRNTKGLGG